MDMRFTGEGLARLRLIFEKAITIAARDDFRLPECHIDLKAGEESDPLLANRGDRASRCGRSPGIAGAARPLRTLQIYRPI